ncbi:hypothetical protein HGM15179_018695, partial [Zosterops borbonicus]
GSPRFRQSPGGALLIANVTRADSAPYRVWCHNAEGGAGADVTLLGDSGTPLALPPELGPAPGGPGGSLRVSGARRDLGGPYECRVDSGVPPPARAIVRLVVTYRPDPPRALRLSEASGTSLSLSWDPGFNGGLPQHFLLRAEGPDAPPSPAALVTSGFSLTLSGLQPETPYDVTVRARNARGDSAPARLRAVTSGAEPHLYEEVEPWGGYEEVPPEPLVTPQGELV